MSNGGKRERRSFIQEGILPESDTLSRILQKDREISGRGAPAQPEADSAVRHERSNAADNEAAKLTSNITSNIDDQRAEDEPAPTREASKPRRESKPRTSKPSLKDKAEELGNTPNVVITLRCPEGLNDWLDDYCHKHRKQKVKKQDLVAQAMKLLYMELEAQTSSTDD